MTIFYIFKLKQDQIVQVIKNGMITDAKINSSHLWFLNESEVLFLII
jgi:hypothetical protein